MDNPETEVIGTTEENEVTEPAKVTEPVEKSGETEVTEEAEETKKSRYPTQVVLSIRIIIGAYVLYLAYQIATSDNEVTPLMWAAVILFIVSGTALVIMSLKHFIAGEYEGGKKDT